LPLLSAANWGGQGLHPRGNFEGFVARGSKQKWLEAHGDAHFAFLHRLRRRLQKVLRPFPEGRRQRLGQAAAVQLQIRHPGETFELRTRTNGRSRARSGRNSISTRKA
jgi:uncharacterized protein